ncbi:hypothetical protein HOP50_03g20290 [Chloropicon primus]|uniref:Uncharacterized protein n=2 Tax=Chloropicon primus TaxID=1764295 RepID=A0A5B8MJI5_9CHLO|nr:hypothetical protein A3770_03p20300 [Chloropicon primus]UPQ98723.1 hypothetical protein HOP50_03g20290 [Chloropicon primus]|eukprot:QDZ19512.1 hypothetical protein A3770_03p20300 [Chloropicon primus]
MAVASTSEPAGEVLYYPQNNSESKNDIPSLVAVLGGLGVLNKGAGGQPTTKTEAAFLLRHHALKSAKEICAAGAVSSCLFVLDNKECGQIERTSAIGLLHTLCKDEANREAIAVWRSPVTQNYTARVVCKFLSSTDDCQASAMGILRLLLEKTATRKTVLSQIELPWRVVLRAIDDTPSDIIVADAMMAMRFATAGNDDLKIHFGKVGGIKVLVSAIRRWKTDNVVEAATGLFYRLLEVEANRILSYQNGVIPMLTRLYKTRGNRPDTVDPNHPQKMFFAQTRAYIVGCLWWIFQIPNVDEVLKEMTDQDVVTIAMEGLKEGVASLAGDDGGGKKKKKKKKSAKVKVHPTMELLMKASTGCLRHLACSDPNKVRIVASGAVPMLTQLAETSTITKIRANAKYTLCLLCILNGCYDYMVASGVPPTIVSLAQAPIPILPSVKAEVLKAPQSADPELLEQIFNPKKEPQEDGEGKPAEG